MMCCQALASVIFFFFLIAMVIVHWCHRYVFEEDVNRERCLGRDALACVLMTSGNGSRRTGVRKMTAMYQREKTCRRGVSTGSVVGGSTFTFPCPSSRPSSLSSDPSVVFVDVPDLHGPEWGQALGWHSNFWPFWQFFTHLIILYTENLWTYDSPRDP